ALKLLVLAKRNEESEGLVKECTRFIEERVSDKDLIRMEQIYKDDDLGDSIRWELATFLSRRLTVDSCCLFYQWSVEFDAPSLRQVIVQFVRDHFTEITSRLAFARMDDEICKRLVIEVATTIETLDEVSSIYSSDVESDGPGLSDL